MDLTWLLNLIPWVLVIVIFIYLYGTWPHSKLDKYGYTGPKTRFMIGNGAEIYSRDCFWGTFDEENKKKYGPVWRCYEFRIPCVVIHDPELLKTVMITKFHNFINRRHVPLRGIVKQSVFDQLGEEWRRNRNLLSPYFTTKKLKQKVEMISKCCDNFLGHIERLQEKNNMFEAKEVAGCFSMDVIAIAGFGLDIDSSKDPNDPFIVNGLKINDIMDPKSKAIKAIGLIGLFPILENCFDLTKLTMWPEGMTEFFTEAIHKAIDQKVKGENKAEDFIMAMLRAHEENLDYEEKVAMGLVDSLDTPEGVKKKGFTNDEVVANSFLLLLAGYDTTSGALSFLMYCLAVHPQYQEKVYQEILEEIGEKTPEYDLIGRLHYLDMCFNESARLYPPFVRMDRRCLSDIQLDKWFIPKDTLVVLPIWAMHHDPEFWPDPETYDPDRFLPENQRLREPCTYLPFGHGPRMCIGNRMAILEVKMAIVRLLQNYTLVPNEKTEIPLTLQKASIFVKSQNGLWLTLEAREKNN